MQARMEREKEELRKYIESDSKAMKEKLSEEERLRKQKEDEMAAKMRDQVRNSMVQILSISRILMPSKESARENEIIQLYEKMSRENAKREAEIDELRARYEKEKEEMRRQLEKERDELRDRLEKENAELRKLLEGQKKGLKDNIDSNFNDGNRRINDIAERLGK